MTHNLVRIVVRAETEEEAVENAMDAVEHNLLAHRVSDGVGCDGPCDYVRKMEDTRVSPDDSPRVLKADSDAGREEITAGWERTREAMTARFSRIRSQMAESTDADLVNDSTARYDMQGCDPGQPGRDHYVHDATMYDQELYPVSTDSKFERSMSDLAGKWVVPFDAHF